MEDVLAVLSMPDDINGQTRARIEAFLTEIPPEASSEQHALFVDTLQNMQEVSIRPYPGGMKHCNGGAGDFYRVQLTPKDGARASHQVYFIQVTEEALYLHGFTARPRDRVVRR